MIELVEFLRARLDEDEWWAREASRDGKDFTPTGEHWRWVDSETDEPATIDPLLDGNLTDIGDLSLRSVEEYPCYDGGSLSHSVIFDGQDMQTTVAGHIARHDPARVLREVAAKRRMLTELLEAARDADGAIFGEWNHHQGLEDLLLSALALPYSDHPDYREEWTP